MAFSAFTADGSPKTRAPRRARSKRAVAAQHVLAELRRDLGQDGRTGLLHIADDLVGVDDDRAELAEAAGDGGLSGGDASGEGDEWHDSRMPRQNFRRS